MNLRTSLAVLTLALGSLVSVPAFAQSVPTYAQNYQGGYASAVVVQPAPVVTVQTPVRAVPPPPVVVRPVPAPIPAPVVVVAQPSGREMEARRMAEQRRQTAEFSARVEAQASQLVAQIRMGVERGTLRAPALREATTLQAQLTNTLRRDTRDGTVSAQDQQQINGLLGQMTRIEAQYRTPERSNGHSNGWDNGHAGAHDNGRGGEGRGR